MERKKSAISTIFAISTLISLILIIPELLNYIEFYKVVERFRIELENITVNNTKMYEGEILVKVEFEATNPTGFVGLKISSVTCRLKYIKDGVLQSLTGITQTFSPHAQVDPPESVILQVDFNLKYKGHNKLIRNFIGYLQTNPEKMDWIVTGQFIVQVYTTILPIQVGPFQHSTYLH